MREICLIYKGDNIDKLSYKLGIDKSLQESGDTIQNYKYAVVKDGDCGVQVIRNYNPYFVSKNINVNKLQQNGYEIINQDSERVIYYKPSGVKYSVKPLETLEDIADKFGVRVDDIIISNSLVTSKLFVGQILVI